MDFSPLFKGATRPACVWGIPIKPFLAVVGIHLLLAFWFYIPLLILCIPWLIVMNRVTKEDDQKFLQLFLKFRTSLPARQNAPYFRGFNSYAPVSYRRDK